jgi:CBS domain-containing protein
VLRSIIWAVNHNMRRATVIAATIGQVVAYMFILGGLFLVFGGDFISGVWLIFIGWFLNNAADASRRQVTMQEAFSGVRVADLMTQQPITAPTHLTVSDLVHDYVLRRNVRSLPIVEGDRLLGIVTLGDIRHVPQDQWETTTVDSIMTPTDRLATVRPEDLLNRAITILAEKDLNLLPVVRGDTLVGVLNRSNLIRFMQIRDELGVSPPTGQ